jgi:phage FluMu protein Com
MSVSPPRCPCCGSLLQTRSETETKITLECPNCKTSELRLKGP